jgi:transcription elongation factor GreA
MADIYLSRDGYEKLRQELEHLKTVKRREISRAIGEARAHGDLSENAEYDAAKDAQGHNEKRVAELEETLSRARLLEDENIPLDQVLIGATVKLLDMDSKEELEYTFVAEEESDFSLNKLSITSPVGSGLLGHKENEVVSVKVPAGILRYKIVKISR